MKRKMLLIPLVLLLIASLVAVGCAAPAPAPAPGPTPATGPQKITWMFGYYGPEKHYDIVYPFKNLAENVAARVWPEYDFELKWAYGGIIAAHGDIIDAVGAGMQDVGKWQPGAGPGKTDIADLGSFPVLPKDFEVASNILLEFFRTPWVKEEHDLWNVDVYTSCVFYPQEIMLTFPAESLADLDGKKIRMWGVYSKIFENLGAVPISMSVAEAYEALQRGTVEGALTGYPATMVTYRWHDIAKNILVTGTGPTGCPIIVNKDSWAALPAKVKEAFLAEANLMPKYSKEWLAKGSEPAFVTFDEAGVVIRDAPPEDTARFKDTVRELVEPTIAKLDEKGLPGSEGWDAFMEIIKKWS